MEFDLIGTLLKIYLDALLRGNPIAVGFTIIVVVGVSVGPFYKGVSSGDPGAIGLMGLVAFLMTVLLAVGLIDRKLNPTERKKRKSKKPPKP